MEINQNMVKLKQDFQTKEAAIRAAGQLLVDNGSADSVQGLRVDALSDSSCQGLWR